MESFHAEVLAEYRAARTKIDVRAPDDEHAAAARAAQDALFETIMTAARERAPPAARAGHAAVDIFKWNGEDALGETGLKILWLVCGPRYGSVPYPVGVSALLPRLTAALEPFALVHDWDSSTHGNRLILRWSPVLQGRPRRPHARHPARLPAARGLAGPSLGPE